LLQRHNLEKSQDFMLDNLLPFLLQWAVSALTLWIASHVFGGIRFASTSSLVVAALLLGFVNAVVRPILIFLTLPLTVITLGLFLLVINAMMLLLVAALVRGFTISGFWTAFFASIFIAVLNLALGALLPGSETSWYRIPHTQGSTIWL
jgi:putative membrane protein